MLFDPDACIQGCYSSNRKRNDQKLTNSRPGAEPGRQGIHGIIFLSFN